MSPERTVAENTAEEQDLADDISMHHGAAWVLVSAHSGGDGLDVRMALGPAMDVELARQLLRKTLEGLS